MSNKKESLNRVREIATRHWHDEKGREAVREVLAEFNEAASDAMTPRRPRPDAGPADGHTGKTQRPKALRPPTK